MSLTPERRYAAPKLLERERAHRRTTLIGVALLLLFVTSPVFGHHIADPLSNWLLGRDHFLVLCVVALHELMEPVHDVFHILLVVGLAYAVFDRARAVIRMQQTLRVIEPGAIEPGGPIHAAALAVGVDPRHLRGVTAPSVPAFTAGLFRPKVYVSEGLASDLSSDELEAVIAHEDAHRRRRDPLRLTVWRFLGCALFFIPALRALVEDMADEAEIAADDVAASDVRVEPLALASALVTIADRYRNRTGLPVPAAVGLLGRDLLDRRVRRLAGEQVAIASHLSRRALGVAGIIIAMAWISGLLVAHPMPTGSDGAAAHAGAEHHCSQHQTSPFSHLFCRGLASGPCPHAADLTASPVPKG